jgi:hypothetical protein
VYRALGVAFEAGDPERACCLAAELAMTQGEMPKLVSFLVDTFAASYVSPDAGDLARVAGGVSAMLTGGEAAQRRGLCDVVVTMAADAVKRHDAVNDLLQSARRACDGQPERVVDRDRDIELLVQWIRDRQQAPEAVLKAYSLLRGDGDGGSGGSGSGSGSGGTASIAAIARALWDACLSSSASSPPRAAYVTYAHSLYLTVASTAAVRRKRTPLLLYALLITCSPAAVALPPAESVRRALARSYSAIDGVFEDVVRDEGQQEHEQEQEQVSDDASEGEPAARQATTTMMNANLEGGETSRGCLPINYLRMYTVYDHHALCRADEEIGHARSAAAAAPVKTITLSRTA